MKAHTNPRGLSSVALMGCAGPITRAKQIQSFYTLDDSSASVLFVYSLLCLQAERRLRRGRRGGNRHLEREGTSAGRSGWSGRIIRLFRATIPFLWRLREPRRIRL